jgi:hypothetical protein
MFWQYCSTECSRCLSRIELCHRIYLYVLWDDDCWFTGPSEPCAVTAGPLVRSLAVCSIFPEFIACLCNSRLVLCQCILWWQYPDLGPSSRKDLQVWTYHNTPENISFRDDGPNLGYCLWWLFYLNIVHVGPLNKKFTFTFISIQMYFWKASYLFISIVHGVACYMDYLNLL